ncbi:MAG: GDP-L-fucose synthase, partial [Desulfobulbaceae bacterium]|nr:GDP-L-fucose synthase [Desulfobulbaceae bacterium]
NIIESSHRHNVEKLLFLGSSCIFPREAPQPIKEEYLLTSPLEKTNEPYAIAKIAGIKLCNAYNRQYGTNFLSVMPTNLYGINDNYHPENAHVIPMLLRRFHEAKENNDPTVTVWGTGTPKREFLFSNDLAEACFFVMKNCNAAEIGEFVNIGTGKDIPISELVVHIKKTVGFQGEILYDTTKPDGTMLKCMDVSRINALGWRHHTELEEGLSIAYKDFLTNQILRK